MPNTGLPGPHQARTRPAPAPQPGPQPGPHQARKAAAGAHERPTPGPHQAPIRLWYGARLDFRLRWKEFWLLDRSRGAGFAFPSLLRTKESGDKACGETVLGPRFGMVTRAYGDMAWALVSGETFRRFDLGGLS